MFGEEILSPSEKIKKIRKKIRATQTDIAGNGISRVRVSQIESGETLTLKVAKLLAENINRFIKENNISCVEITAEYLLESEEDQINQICRDKIKVLNDFGTNENIKNSFESELFLLEKFISRNDLIVEKVLKKELYKLASTYYNSIRDYMKSYEYTLKCYRLLNSDEYMEHIALILRFTQVYIWLGKFDDVVMISKQAYSLAKAHNLESIRECKSIYFNCALAYKKLENYEECYVWLQRMYDHCKVEKVDELKIKTLQANCYFIQNKVKEAIKLNYEVLELSQELATPNETALAYANLAYIYYKQNNTSKAITLINSALDIKESEYIGGIYGYAFLIYKETAEKEKAYSYLDNALHELCKASNKNELNEIIQESFAYFTSNNLPEKVMYLINKIEEIVINYNLLDNSILNIFIKAQYYFKDIDAVLYNEIFMKTYKLVDFFEKDKK